MRRALAATLALAAAFGCAASAATFSVESVADEPAGQAWGLPSAGTPNPPGQATLPLLLAIPPALPEFRTYAQLLELWRGAGAAYGVPWQVLAAINKVESNFGQNTGPSSAGAIGWMQFMPSTWEMWGTDANGDGVADPWNPEDAVYSAARYLAAAGAHEDLYRAIFAYNHADWYVQQVLDLASSAVAAGMTFPLPEGAWTRGGGPDAHMAGGRGDNWQSLNAVDLMANPGTPVLAVFDGVVTEVSDYQPPHQAESGAIISGGSVSLTGYDGTEVFYTHLESVAVVVGEPVAAGDQIAAVASGTPGGPHLHFAIEPPASPEALFGGGGFGQLFSGGFGLARVFARADLQEQLTAAWRAVRLARAAVARAEDGLAQRQVASLEAGQQAGAPELTTEEFRALEAEIAELDASQVEARARLIRAQDRLGRALARLERLRSESATVSFTHLVGAPLAYGSSLASGGSATRSLAGAAAPTQTRVFTVVGRGVAQEEAVVAFTR